jgi:hypothetical protein
MSITSYPVLAGATYSSSSAPWYMQVARGKVAGCTPINVFAASDQVKTGTPQTIWELSGTTTYAFPTSAQQMHVVSTSTLDNSGSYVVISGIDASWNLLVETVYMNGTTVVTTTNSFLRINSVAFIPTTGQTSNVGTITVKNTAGTITYAQITATYGRSAMSLYSVPAGFTLFVTNIHAFSGDASGNSAWVIYRSRTINNALTVPSTTTALDTTFNSVYDNTRVLPFPYTEKTDIQWQFATNTGTHSVGLILEAVLISNTAA